MPWTGWKIPGSSGDYNGSYGSNAWVSAGAIEADDGSAATSTNSTGGTRSLWFRDHGFTTADIPNGAIITGVQGRAEIRRTNTSPVAWAGYYAGLWNTLTPTADGNMTAKSAEIKGGGAGAWPTSYTITDGGDQSNLVGTGITDAEVRSGYFGGFLAASFSGPSTGSAQVDYVALRVFYLLNNIDAKDAGTWKAPDPKAKHSGTWKTPTGVWAKNASGVWVRVYG